MTQVNQAASEKTKYSTCPGMADKIICEKSAQVRLIRVLCVLCTIPRLEALGNNSRQRSEVMQ